MKNFNLLIAILVLSVSGHVYVGSNKGQFSEGKGNRSMQV